MTLLLDELTNLFSSAANDISIAQDAIPVIELSPSNLIATAETLRDHPSFQFDLLIDVCGVDFLDYGQSQWRTEETTFSGFSRGVKLTPDEQMVNWNKPRFAAVYQLLSTVHNHRVRLRVLADGDPPLIPSVVPIWDSANWYEREAFDLYGIIFDGHPDLRRLLTDYGFIGHPFRKDFPLIGEVELRYDAKQARCVYEPVSIRQRVLVPKVIRDDARYLEEEK